MHAYTSHLIWTRGEQGFVDNQYSRRHEITFDGGLTVPGSSSPWVVKLPYSDPSALDPEEAFVASLSSCHMLWFLSIAAGRGFCVDQYVDQAQGIMRRNARGKLAMTIVTLQPEVTFSGDARPTQEVFIAMHHQAHEECFIANSVLTEVRCEPVLTMAS